MYKLIFCALLLTTAVVSSTDAMSEPPRKSIYEVIRKQADRVYASGDYRHAVLLYRRYYARYADAPTAQRLADCYWQIGYYDSAMTYLQRCDKSSVEVRERMAEIHARKGAYTEAINEYDALMKMGTEKESWYRMRRDGFTNAAAMYRDSMDWKLDYLSVNTRAHETSPFVYRGYLYVVSNRTMDGGMMPVGSTLRPATHLYTQKAGALDAIRTRSVQYVREVPFDYTRRYLPDLTVRASNDSRTLMPGIAKQKMAFTGTTLQPLFDRAPLSDAVGPVSFSGDGKKVYYSRIKKDKDGNGSLLELCSAVRKGNGWSSVEVLTINDSTSASYHPHMADDGRTLYFTSNRKGGKGGADLYRATLQDDGSWSQVENITDANTAGDEQYPSLSDGKLYFSSTGLPGLGGADLFSIPAAGGKPENMGYPVNSAGDDHAMVFTGKGAGYVSTNRYGSDDVLRFAMEKKYVTVSRTLLNQGTGLREKGVEVTLEQQQENGSWMVVEKQTTDHRGVYRFKVRPNYSNYRVRLNKEGMAEQTLALDTRGITSWREDAALTLPIANASQGNSTSNNTNTPIPNNQYTNPQYPNNQYTNNTNEYRLYHLFDKKELDSESREVLYTLIAMMDANPDLQVELVSAADCIGSDGYNMALSQRRAKYVSQLFSRSLRSRVRVRWVGARNPIASCDEAMLTPDTQRTNRYTIVTILK